MTAWRPAILGHVRNDREYRDGRPEDWRDSALCLQVDPEQWHPDKGGHATEAKAICAKCPVIAECLEWALTFEPHVEGIAGGTSFRERTKIRTARRNAQKEAS